MPFGAYVTKPTYRAGTPSAKARGRKAAETKARQRAEHEAALAARRERDRARREEKRRAEAEAQRKRDAVNARRRELYAEKKKREAAAAAERAYRAPRRGPDGRFGPSQATLDARAAEARRAGARERIRQRAAAATTRRVGEEARGAYELERARIDERWQAWLEQATDRVDDVRVNYQDAADRLIDPFDPTSSVTFRVLLRYVQAGEAPEHAEWVVTGAEGELAGQWAASGQLPAAAADAPVSHFWEERVTTSPIQMLNRVFSASFVRAIGARVEPGPTDPRAAELVKRADQYVADERAYRARRREQAAERRRRRGE